MMKRCGIVLCLVLAMAVGVWGQEASTPPVKWSIGTKVEVKEGSRWSNATITDTRGEWHLVTYERGGWKEWVEPWRIRQVGWTEDNVGIVMSNRKMSRLSKQLDAPPREKPGAAPKPRDATRDLVQTNRTKEGGVSLSKEKELWSSATDRAWEGRSAWSYKPSVEVAVKEGEKGDGGVGEGAGGTVNVRTTADFGSSVSLASTRGPKMMIWIGQLQARRGGVNTARGATVERVDLSSRMRSTCFELEPGRALLDGSSDGQRVLVKVEGSWPHYEGSVLEIWKVVDGGDKLEKTAEFEPFDEDVIDAWFVDDSRIMVLGRTVAGLWDLTSKEGTGGGIWLAKRTSVDRSVTPAITRDGKYVAFGTVTGRTGGGAGVMLVEMATGEEVGFLPRLSHHAKLQFSPSGKQLVASSDSGIEAWDLAEGKRWRTLCVDQMSTQSHVVVPSDGYVLLNGEYLVDLERRAVVWKYDHRSSEGLVTAEGLYRSFQDGRLSARIVAGKRETSAGERIKAEDFWIIKTGMTISINVNVPADQNALLRAKFVKSCEEAGMRVVDAGDSPAIKLTARTSTGKSESITYDFRPFGRPFEVHKHTVTAVEQISELTLEAGGKQLWDRKSAYKHPPHVLVLKQGQTAQQAMDEQHKPNMTIFQSVWIPEYWITTRSVGGGEEMPGKSAPKSAPKNKKPNEGTLITQM